MQSERIIFGVVLSGCLLSSFIASAGELGSAVTLTSDYQPVISLIGGVASVNMSHSQAFIGTDDDRFVYNSNHSNKTTGLIGAFLGVEHQLPYPYLFMQAGLEYSYFANVNAGGSNSVGIEPLTSTLYHYNYHIQTQQILALAKLFTTTELPKTAHHPIYPYVAVGLGAAFNHAGQYNATAQEAGSLNITPTFNSNTNTAFSYSLGLGVDTNVDQHIRIGVGYRFSSFGNASLGNGNIVFNNHTFPVPFTLNVTNPYANQFVAQISYLA